MDSARDLVTYETQRDGNLHRLVVSKTDAFLSTSMWEQRLQVANNMFEAIGWENVEKIIGDRFVDVRKALEGRDAFHLDDTAAQRQKQNVPSPASTPVVNTTTIGRKRKLDSDR